MTNDWIQTSVLLGAGGNCPGVATYRGDHDQEERFIDLPPGESVYALDVSGAGGDIVMGTKAGNLYWFNKNQSPTGGPVNLVQERTQGAPILAVCFIDPQNVAVSDAAGRCFIWPAGQENPSRTFVTDSRVICSLVKLDNNCLAGLAVTGELLFWQGSTGELTRQIRVPSPPALCGLVRLLYWPAARGLLWPGEKGQLVIYSLEENCLHHLQAHGGDFYAMDIFAENLITAGNIVGSLKFWRAGADDPALTYAVPPGAIALACLPGPEASLLLVNESGQVSIYAFDQDKGIRLTRMLSGRDYRVALGPPRDGPWRPKAQQQELEARQLAYEIEEKIRQKQFDNIEELHHRLVELGYRHVSLVLRAKQARARQDIIDELRNYCECLKLQPMARPGVEKALFRYAQLLKMVWQLDEVKVVWEQIIAARSNLVTDAQMQELGRRIEMLQSGQYVIETKMSPLKLIQAADALGKPFTGRFLINTYGHQSCPNVTITPEEVVEKCEEKQREGEFRGLPPAQHQRLYWISHDHVEPIDMVTFSDKTSSPVRELQFGLKILPAGAQQSVVVPVVMFCVDRGDSDSPIERHNKNALAAWRRINNRAVTGSWLHTVRHDAIMAIRLLLGSAPDKR